MHKLYRRFSLAAASFLFAQLATAADVEELTSDNYAKDGTEKAVVILHVNWGRQWGCAKLDNAQLQALKFSRIPSINASISLETPSALTAKDSFIPYTFLIQPGEYAISDFDVKVARSSSDVQHMKAEPAHLFKDGKPIGGTFSAGAGEIVYLGHFSLDCKKEPIPWRYYIDGRKEFEGYVSGFKKAFPFVKDKPVQFRLFSTTMFGEPYALE